jgi:hypothetical protein
MFTSKQAKTFGLSLLGAGLLYFPALPLATELARNLPEAKRWNEPPEIGILPFLFIYWGAVVALILLYRIKPKSTLVSRMVRFATGSGLGGLVASLLLTLLGRGWEGFLVWFNPAFWLLTLVIAGVGLVTGAIWGGIAIIAKKFPLP